MKGFTLIEMLVSITIFSVVMTMALGALLALSVADRKAETLKSGIDNLTFALDSMSRAIRTGQNYHCGTSGIGTTQQSCPAAAGDNYLTFLASFGSFTQQTYYRLDAAQDATSQCGQTLLPYGCIERSYDGSSWTPITSPDIVVQNVGSLFRVTGANAGDNIQPKVVITINATIPVSATQTTSVHMQTAVTQRIYDQ